MSKYTIGDRVAVRVYGEAHDRHDLPGLVQGRDHDSWLTFGVVISVTRITGQRGSERYLVEFDDGEEEWFQETDLREEPPE